MTPRQPWDRSDQLVAEFLQRRGFSIHGIARAMGRWDATVRYRLDKDFAEKMNGRSIDYYRQHITERRAAARTYQRRRRQEAA